MVQVGYKYYSQTYDIKKKKLEAMHPRYKDADRFGSRLKDLPNLDSSMINAKNAEIYLNNGGENSKPKRGPGSKKRKASKNQGGNKSTVN